MADWRRWGESRSPASMMIPMSVIAPATTIISVAIVTPVMLRTRAAHAGGWPSWSGLGQGRHRVYANDHRDQKTSHDNLS